MTRRLAGIFALIVMIGAGITIAAGAIAARRAMSTLQQNAEASATLHNAVLRSELEKFRLIPTALASDPEAAAALSGNRQSIASLDRRLEQLSGNIRAAAIYLIDANGRTIAASNWSSPNSFVGANYSFRDYFRRALAEGSYEQFALGTVSREPGLYLARRITTGDARGVIVVKVEFTSLEDEWAQSGEPAFVTDGRGIVLVTSIPAWRFLSLGALPKTERTAIRHNLDFGNAPLTPLPAIFRHLRQTEVADVSIGGGEPQPYIVAQKRTAIQGWTLHVMTPIGAVVSNAANSARLATAMIMALLLLAIWLVVRRQGRARAREAAVAAAQIELEREVDARTRDLRNVNDRLQIEMQDRLASEARLHEAREQLVQANKLASLGQIAAGVAHEVNQPVAAIFNYAYIGEQYLERARHDDAADSFRSIADMTRRIGVITGELRGFARKAAGTLGDVRLDDAIDGALLLLRERIARESVTIDRKDADGILVRAERIRLEQVLVNLLSNALDAVAGTRDAVVTLNTHQDGRFIDLDVANNGPAIDASIAASLFQPFNSSKENGLGLGLVISRDIMTDFGGSLSHVPLDHGAIFRVRLVRA